MRIRGCLAGLTALLLGSCSLAPDYKGPTVGTPQTFKNQKPVDGWVQAEPAAAQFPKGEWWRAFNDDILNILEAEVTDANQSLQAGLAAAEQNSEAVQAAGAALFPLIQADASATREHQSVNRPLFGSSTLHTYNDHIVSLSGTYDLDVFGRLRNSLAVAQSGSEASTDDLLSLSLTLHADLAADYFQLREQDALMRILGDTIMAYAKQLDLTQLLFNQGLAAGVDVAQAQSQLELAKAQSDSVALARAKLEDAISVLIGQPAPTFKVAADTFDIKPPVIPAGIPSEVLERRPDVAAAERRVAAANSDIGVAAAAFYPDFQFDISGGFESEHLKDWIAGPSKFWSIGPTGMLTLFDAGEREAVLAEASEAYNQTVANYRQTVLQAYQQVEDALASMRMLDKQEIDQEGAVTAAQAELNYANQRYANGLNTYLEVVTAQTTLLTAQQGLAEVQAQRILARVALIQALGGGWGPLASTTPPNPDPASLAHVGEPGSIYNNLDPHFSDFLP